MLFSFAFLLKKILPEKWLKPSWERQRPRHYKAVGVRAPWIGAKHWVKHPQGPRSQSHLDAQRINRHQDTKRGKMRTGALRRQDAEKEDDDKNIRMRDKATL